MSDEKNKPRRRAAPPAGSRQRVAVLGSTGSIGVSTLDVVARHPERFQVVGLSAFQRVDELFQQCRQFRPRVAVLPDEAAAQRLRALLAAEDLPVDVQSGAQALSDLAAAEDVDSVMAAIVGAAGLPSCMAAALAGKRLLLANKEALVVGGALFMQAVAEGGATLLPIDSEHSAIFQCLPEDASTWPRRTTTTPQARGAFRPRPTPAGRPRQRQRQAPSPNRPWPGSTVPIPSRRQPSVPGSTRQRARGCGRQVLPATQQPGRAR